jgi:signal peptidase II
MNPRTAAFTTAGIVFVLDQLVKWLVDGPLNLKQVGDTLVLLPIFELKRVHNYGVSLGMLQANTDTTRWLLVALTAVIAAGVAWWMFRERNRQDLLALSLVLGGALGNIVDRVRLGYVLDYANLHFGDWSPFLIFNVADAGITVGVLILLLRAVLVREKTPVPLETPSDA